MAASFAFPAGQTIFFKQRQSPGRLHNRLAISQNKDVRKDLLYGMRALRRSPVFTVAAVLSLALGIGANTAIFSLLDQVVLRSLPVADPERLVALHGSYSGPGDSSSSWSTNSESVFPYPFYQDLRDRVPALSGILGCAIAPVRVGWQSGTQAAQAEMVSGNVHRVAVMAQTSRAGSLRASRIVIQIAPPKNSAR